MSERKPTKPNECPNAAKHTPHPSGYIEHEEWARKKMKTHKQVKCPGCGRFEIWVKK
jgi:hypothetical protein